VALVSTGD